MSGREITEDQALRIREILEEECGLRPTDRYDGFVRSITTTGKLSICHEFRFMGSLGFGGKFRNNGNNGNVPYVDCYQEDLTPLRTAQMANANWRIASLFRRAPSLPVQRGET
ncbi:MAG: hypothetical protein H0T60_10390 [Acidobacteria bacterium]|nr:hypothetical protein [Acidobacteriota bacterium]